MAKSEQSHLLDLWDKNICPYCGTHFMENQRVGSGQKAKGGFCSLDCYARYYALELHERAKRVQDISSKDETP